MTKPHIAIHNTALKPFNILVGEWDTVGTHPLMPGITLHGHTTFEWIEGGAFLIMYSSIEEEGVPSGVAIFGSDDATKECYMLYFDERGVSRKYEVTLQGNIWKFWRNAPGFSQRLTGTFADDSQTLVTVGELSRDDSTWKPDLELTYTRVK
jgi:hypothetical protein